MAHSFNFLFPNKAFGTDINLPSIKITIGRNNIFISFPDEMFNFFRNMQIPKFIPMNKGV